MTADNSVFGRFIHRFKSTNRSYLIWLPVVVLYFLLITIATESNTAADRIIAIRYFNFVLCGFFAFIIPHIQFPDSGRYIIQAMNPAPKQLLSYLLKSYLPLVFVFGGGFFLLAFWDLTTPLTGLPEKLFGFLYGLIFMIAIAGAALKSYSTLGARSQQWQEGQRGISFLNSMKSLGQTPSIPPGGFPSILATITISGGGMLLVVAGAYISGITGILWIELLPGAVLFGYVVNRFLSIKEIFDRFFYHTNAFYAELFLNPRAMRDGREPLKYNALYWVPQKWRPAAWFSLLQLDRKMPLGRLLVIAHLSLWTLYYAGASDALIFVFLSLMILGKCMTLFILTSRSFSPPVFQYVLHPPRDWIAIRFFCNLRWVPLLALSLWIVSLFSGRVSHSFILWWAAADIFASLLTAILFTLRKEYRSISSYA